MVKDNGGTALESAWILTATGTGSQDPAFLSGPGAAGSTDVVSGVSFDAGTYTLAESGPDGYTPSGWDCGAGTVTEVTLALGETKTCTITNDDVAPSLTLNKILVNDNGGGASESQWMLTATGTGSQDPAFLSGPGAAGSADVVSGADFDAGTYDLEESVGPAGYTATSWDCGSGPVTSVTLALGADITCTITNDDIQPQLTVIKHVIKDDSGTANADDFAITVTGINATPSEFPGNEGGVIVDLDAGLYSVSESGPGGYTPNFSADCFGTIAVGEARTCTITNDDIGPDDATLTVIKTMVNIDGGTDVAGGFMMTVTLPGGGTVSFPGASGPGTTIGLALGDYTVTEVEHAGYAASYSDDCTGEVIATTDHFTCTITNDDIGPRLTVTKTVTNGNGGTMGVANFPLFVDDVLVMSDEENTFKAGQLYTVSETPDPGYVASVWGGDCAADGTITMELDTDYTCTITNDDVAPSLTLVKEMKNDNGGTAGPGDWNLTATGTLDIPTNLNGTTGVASDAGFKADTYTLFEIDGPAGYTSSGWDCGAGIVISVTLALGDDVTCTITNDDDAPSLTLIKTVTNDDGGKAEPGDWTLTATGRTTISGDGPSVSSGADFHAGSYVLTESGPGGYSTSGYRCVGGTQTVQSITLGLGESATLHHHQRRHRASVDGNQGGGRWRRVAEPLYNAGGRRQPQPVLLPRRCGHHHHPGCGRLQRRGDRTRRIRRYLL